ncbi:unnamed protein product [Schistosoma margrebowiei]|uniref:Uncharacterized protein n=1 Tax=Schistosoma margrebowiei TaxID=48269 RepID=A0A183LGP6_9TREM|nr:unnamed protein product [Schistosoma margrebowiei]
MRRFNLTMLRISGIHWINAEQNGIVLGEMLLKKYTEDPATKNAMRTGNMKQLNGTTKKLAEKYPKAERWFKDK